MKKISQYFIKLLICFSMIFILLVFSGCRVLIQETTNKISTPYYERKLKAAVEYDRLEMAKEALSEGADINHFNVTSFKKAGKTEKNPLFIALDMNAFNTAEYLIEQGASLNSYQNQDGETYLTFFSTRQFSQFARFIPLLLKNGADPTQTDSVGNTPLDKMLTYSDFSDKYMREFIDLFQQFGDVIDKDTIKIAYYYYGCSMLPEMIEELKKQGKDTGLSDFEEDIILGRSDEVKEEISKKILNNYEDEDILKLITSYCDSVSLDKCLKLIEKEYTLDSLLLIASRAGNLENVKHLIDLGADINYKTESGRTPLLWAIFNDHYDVVKVLLEHNAKMQLDHSSDATEGITNELCAAAMNGNIEMLQLLISNIAELKDEDVSFAIQTAANFQQESIINYFFKIGYNGEILDDNTQSVLEAVMYYRNDKVVKLLIEHGANVNGKVVDGIDRRGNILDYAINYGTEEIVKCLLENGAKPNITHLIDAIHKANLEEVKLLVEYGADVNGATEDGTPVIYYAAAYSNNILKYLVESGADVNMCETDKGTPPLTIAVNNGMVDNTKYLIEVGADTSIKNSTGKTAYDFAKESGYEPMLEMFQEMNVTE